MPSRCAAAKSPWATRAAGLWQPEVVEDLVVSLTSFPVRIGKLHRVIRGLLAQSLQPRKIVLYLSLEEFPDRALPKELMALTSDRFEIRFVEGNLRPYKKLLYALADFPRATILTVDDDNLYPSDCLARVAGVRGQPANGHLRARPVHADPRRGNFALHGLEGHAIIRAELHDLPGGGGGSSFILRDR
jgi:hypothetical protein